MNRSVLTLVAVVTVFLAVGAGCASDTDGSASGAADASVGNSPTVAPSSTDPDSSAGSSEMTVGASTPDASTTLAVIVDTGVPGLDSSDGFCRAWSEFAGSFQALAFVSSAAADSFVAARAEVAASGAIVAAVETLGAELPAVLESERAALTVDLVGPMARRSGLAIEALESAGLDREQIAAVGDAWLVALASTGLDDPNIVVAVDANLAGPLDAAATVFAESVPPISRDPSLITDAATPLTFEYLAANCPDQGVLGGNDVVAQP